MSKKLLISVLFIFLYHVVTAQTIPLDITLKTTGRDSLTYATLQIYRLPDTLLIESRIGSTGMNRFAVKPNATYLLKVSAIGFGSATQLISVTNKSLQVAIELKSENNTLHAVTILAQKPLMRQEDDKTIVDAEPLANSSTNAYEVLEKVPGIVLDQDGNVYLSSSTPATIYINGRQMRMSTEDIAALLKSLPAGSISSIEILRTPSAKYDAANSGGIVNVVLKKGIKIGTTGSVNLRYDQGVYGTVSAEFSLNHTAGKISSYLSCQYTDRHYFEDVRSHRSFSGDTLLSQESFIKYSPGTNYVGAGIDLAMSRKLNLSYDLRLTATGNNSHTVSSNNFSNTDAQNGFYQSQTPISNKGHSLFISNSISSRYSIDSSGSTWNNEIVYTYTDANNAQAYTNEYILPPANAVAGRGNVYSPAAVLDIKSDLSLRLPYQFLLETGIKLSDARNHNNALYYTQTGSSPEQVDPYQTNRFAYKENIYSAYLQGTKTIHAFSLKAGLRLEHTGMDGHQQVPVDTSFSINRNDLFPYFYVKRPLFKIFGYPLTGNAIFRRSITRPTYDALNPYPKFVDPFTYNVGNPDLKPQFTTNYEINATYNEFPVFAVGINDTRDVISPVTYQNDLTKVGFRTYDNLGRYKEIYGRLFGGLPAGHKYFMYAGVQYNLIQYTGTYQHTPLHYSRGSWTFFMGHDLKLTPTLKCNLNGWMYVNGFRSFYELKPMAQVNMNITRTLQKNKLSLVLFGNDLFRTNKSVFHLQQAGILVNGTRTQDSRRFGLTLRYNFGVAHKEEKKDLFEQQPVNTEPNQ
ncbi:MAG TPA: outer membrane beta-barrel family protein [Puia sp.]|nr:outer membrane beta-barrel family protein [Puia sp.]